MENSLMCRQSGFTSPRMFMENVITRRLMNISLSKCQDVASVFTGRINTLDIDNDEHRYLLSGCSDGSLTIHDLCNFTGKVSYTAKCMNHVPAKSRYSHSSSVECVTWNPTGNGMFVSSGSDMKLKIWDTNLLKPLETIKMKQRINHHQFSHDSSSIIAVASDSNVVEIVDLRTGHASHQLSGHGSSIIALAWSPRETFLLLSAGMDGRVKMWDVRSSAGSLQCLDADGGGAAHSGATNGLSFTPDGLHIVTFGKDNQLRLWDSTGNPLPVDYGRITNCCQRKIQIAVDRVVFVPSGGYIHVVDLWTGETVSYLRGHYNRVLCCFYRDEYQEVYSGGVDQTILVWTCNIPESDAGDVIDDWSSDNDEV